MDGPRGPRPRGGPIGPMRGGRGGFDGARRRGGMMMMGGMRPPPPMGMGMGPPPHHHPMHHPHHPPHPMHPHHHPHRPPHPPPPHPHPHHHPGMGGPPMMGMRPGRPFPPPHDRGGGGDFRRGGGGGGGFRGGAGGGAGPRRGYANAATPQGPGPHPVPTIETRQVPPQNRDQGGGGYNNNRNPANFAAGKPDRGPIQNRGNFVNRDNKGGMRVPPKPVPTANTNVQTVAASKPKPGDKPAEAPASSGIPILERNAVPVIGGGIKRLDRGGGGQHPGAKRPRRDFVPNRPPQQNYNKPNSNHHHGNNQQQQQQNGYGRQNHHNNYQYDNQPHMDSYGQQHNQYSQNSYGNDNGYNNMQYGSSQGGGGSYGSNSGYSAPVSSSQGYEMSDYGSQYQNSEPPPMYSDQYSGGSGYEQNSGSQYGHMQYNAPSYQQPPPVQQPSYNYDNQGYMPPVDYGSKSDYGPQQSYY